MQGPKARTRRLNRGLPFYLFGALRQTRQKSDKAREPAEHMQKYKATNVLTPRHGPRHLAHRPLPTCTLRTSALPTPWPRDVPCGHFPFPTSSTFSHIFLPQATAQSRQLPNLERSMRWGNGALWILGTLQPCSTMQLCLRHMSPHVTLKKFFYACWDQRICGLFFFLFLFFL